jgi:WD40-like Beta Propeller Repeat
VRRELERIEIPGEHEARDRAWELARAAFADRQPAAARTSLVRPLLVATALAALLTGALSPPGRAVVDAVRKAIGVESAEEALFSLPVEGRLLVASDGGAWVVARDGGKRRLGDYREATWSPLGRFVAAVGESQLAALEPDGDVRWTLSRPRVRRPAWGGSRADTRLAYLSDGLRVVAGDGTGDRLLSRSVAQVTPAWRPGGRHVLAYVLPSGAVTAMDVDRRRRLWRSGPPPGGARPRTLAWSPEGDTVYVVYDRFYTNLLLTDRLHLRTAYATGLMRTGTATDASFDPEGRRLALLRRVGGRSELVVDGRRLFSGTGTFTDLAWSPDGNWLLVTWREPDQWLFVRATGPRRVRAVANVSRQFESRSFPRIAGWCCPG